MVLPLPRIASSLPSKTQWKKILILLKSVEVTKDLF